MNRWFLLKIALPIALGCGSSGCGTPVPPPDFSVRFRAVSDDGTALADVVIGAHGRHVGKTTERGELVAKMHGSEGEAVPVSIQCGADYRSPEQPPPVRLASTRRIVSGQELPGIPYEVLCVRRQRNVVIIARAEKLSGIPITVEGRQVALTDADGNAQALVRLDANIAQLHVAFDTSNRPELLPRNPGRACEVAPGDDIVTLEQKFSIAPKSARRRISSPPKHIPVRID
ncbi:MAG TPA: hypothetical protein VJV79_12600 [Polyangiaceae bacterium]|nr:hypothetical protein [Polyangiaceae bacterium]